MAIVTGITSNYTDPNSGTTLTNAWLQIRQINYVAEVSCLVVVDVYMSEAAYQSGLSPVFYNVLPIVNASSSNFTTYFSINNMKIANHDILSQAVAYLMTQY